MYCDIDLDLFVSGHVTSSVGHVIWVALSLNSRPFVIWQYSTHYPIKMAFV